MRIHAARLRVAFSLVELVIALGTIAVLLGLMLPTIQRIREAANRTRCTSNLRQIGLAIANYHDSFGYLPPSREAQGKVGTSWSWLILPQLGEDNLYRKWAYLKPWEQHSPGERQAAIEAFATPVSIYFCPSRLGPMIGSASGEDHFPWVSYGVKQVAYGNYAACGGKSGDDVLFPEVGLPIPPNGAFQSVLHPAYYSVFGIPKKIRYSEITDGLSQTLLVGEWLHLESAYNGANTMPSISGNNVAVAGANPIYAPLRPRLGSRIPNRFGSKHPGICQFVFCDGRVQQVNVNTDPVILGLLAQRNDGIAVFESDYEP